ncbi:MAG: hypothetical protein PHY09_08030 [Desulfuromonadaceae bacterium]|nr:hypothetical protein [Desulfuromonadaceae bacterium]MDD5106274.1 hypothetical protein [Desulfuromonadaceae bacterium]
MTTSKQAVKNTGKRRKKHAVNQREYAAKTVISVRISDEEKKRIDEIMCSININRYSDVLKIAIQMFQAADNEKY